MRQILLEGRALPIFPCRFDKRPTCPHGFKDAVADAAGIAQLWSLYYGSLIGVPTGAASSLDVIDVDPRKGGDRWFQENRARLPLTRTHETPSGGWHLTFDTYPVCDAATGRSRQASISKATAAMSYIGQPLAVAFWSKDQLQTFRGGSLMN